MGITKDDLELVDVEKLLAQKSLYQFMKLAWKQLEGHELDDGWHIKAVCDHLEAVKRGEIKRLIINVPPRSLKSVITSVFFPAWSWIDNPEIQFLTGSHTASLAIRDTVRTRELINTGWYQEKFGDSFSFTADQNQKTFYKNNKFGYRMSFSIKGALTGNGGDIIIVDDPIDYLKAVSADTVEGVNKWFSGSLMSRRNSYENTAVVIIMQRLHENDLSGYLLEMKGWEHLCLPTLYEPDRKSSTSIFVDPREEKDDILNKRFTPSALEEIKVHLGSRGFAAQHQQQPAPAEGAIFLYEWWNYYRELPKFNIVILSYDTAFGEKKTNDYTAMSAWGIKEGKYYLLGWWKARLDITKLIPRILEDHASYPTSKILVENKASGQDIIAILKKKTKLNITPINPVGDKIERAHAATVPIEAGNVLLPHPSIDSSTDDLITELSMFPYAAHDDVVDSITQAINYAQRKYRYDSVPRVILV